jgi:hypothetical protein
MRTPLDPAIAERRVLEWVVRQRGGREAGREAPAHPPVVTLSRQMGSDDGQIVAALLAGLGDRWHVWDSDLLDEVALRADRRRQLLEAIDEKVQSQIDLTIRSLVGAPVVEEITYIRHLMRVMLTLAHDGHAIIVGRGGNFIVRDALKVRLRAPFAVRVENGRRASGGTREEAEQRVRAADHARSEFIRTEFERDIDDPDAYDVILRTDSLGVEASAAAIAGAVRARFPTDKVTR